MSDPSLPFPYPDSAVRRPEPLPCVIVTGPRAAGKTRWLQRRIAVLTARQPMQKCAVLLAEEGHTRMERFVAETPGVSVEKIFLPCYCCPGQAGMDWAIRKLLERADASRLFLEVPAIAAPGLIAEFDRVFGWPRRVIVFLTGAWEAAQREERLAYFQTVVLGLADSVVTGEAEADSLEIDPP